MERVRTFVHMVKFGAIYREAFSPPATVMTPTMISPVSNRRTPALTPNVLSMVNSSTRNSAGVRLLLTGLIIVGVITVAGGEKALR